MEILVRPVDSTSWAAVAAVFGATGGTGGCWCMSWRISASAYNQNGSARNEALLREMVRSGRPIGLLASAAGEPAGWCSASPREDYGRIVRSPALQLDNLSRSDVWSVVCFYGRAEFRRNGVMAALLDGAIRYAEEQGAGLLEAYPAGDGASKGALHGGSMQLFTAAGFEPAGPPKGRRVVMRRELSTAR